MLVHGNEHSITLSCIFTQMPQFGNLSHCQTQLVIQAKQIILVYCGTPIIFVGIITCFLSFLLFWRDKLSNGSTRLVLTMVVMSDLMYLIFVFIFFTMKRILPGDWALVKFLYDPYVDGFTFYFLNVAELNRNWLVVTIAVERLIFFVKPLAFKKIWSVCLVKKIVGLVLIASFVFRIPSLIYGYVRRVDDFKNMERVTNIIHTLTDTIFLNGIPLLLMITLCTLTTGSVLTVMRTKSIIFKPLNNVERIEYLLAKKCHSIVTTLQIVLLTFVITSSPSFPASKFC